MLFTAILARLESDRKMLVKIKDVFEKSGSKKLCRLVGSYQLRTIDNLGDRCRKLDKTLWLCVAFIRNLL